jgi:hypothetical protein
MPIHNFCTSFPKCPCPEHIAEVVGPILGVSGAVACTPAVSTRPSSSQKHVPGNLRSLGVGLRGTARVLRLGAREPEEGLCKGRSS